MDKPLSSQSADEAGANLKPVNIGICGLGTVGRGTFEVLRRNAQVVAARARLSLQVTHVGTRREHAGLDLGASRVSRDIFEVARDPGREGLLAEVAEHLGLEALGEGARDEARAPSGPHS